MRALVTGGAGFIGSHLVEALLDRGDQVAVLDDLSTGGRENLAAALDGGAELLAGDIADAAAVGRAFEANRPELVFHLAAQADVRRSVAEPAFDLRVNVGGTVNLLEAARAGGARRFVFASTSGAIYGEGAGRELPLSEEDECRPDSPYGVSKLASEEYLALYGRLHGLSAIALRLANVYGPRQDPRGEAGVVAIFCERMLASAPPTVYGDGHQTREFVYVGDVVEAMLAAADSAAGGPHNVSTGRETSVLALGELLAPLCGQPSFAPRMAPPRTGEIQRILTDSRRAEQAFGWRARIELAEGLRRTVAFYRGERAPGRPTEAPAAGS